MLDALVATSSSAAAAVAAAAPVTLASPAMLAGAASLALACIVMAIARRIALPRGAMILMIAGLACLCLATGGLTWQRRYVGHVAVVVDLSPSTVSATYHDRPSLESRIAQLLGRTPFTLYQLADGVRRAPSQSPGDLPSQAECRETTYAPPPAADAVVLFSDARFAPGKTAESADVSSSSSPPPPSSPPPQTFVVIDPALEQPPDAAIERLEVRNDTVVATLRNSGPAGSRRITLAGSDIAKMPLGTGRFVVTGKIVAGTREVVGAIGPRDYWSLNDSLSVRIPPPAVAEKWWIGAGPAPASAWVHIDPADVPHELADYLAAGVIVLDNVPADSIAEMPRLRLQQYARDLGGGIVILGGDRAYAAGGYAGTTLEDLSPLASTPPKPAAQWLLLADSSGSMARTIGDNSRWNFAVDAIGRIIPRLPPDDTISVGNFAEALRWWIAGRRVREAQAGFGTPRELRPHGPTNLAAALRLIADTADAALPTQLLLITDAEAKIDNVATLSAAFAAKNVRVSVLATDKIATGDPLQLIAQRTGGRIVGQSDPRQWARELKFMMRAASPPWLGREELLVRRTDAGPPFPLLRVTPPWNRTWLKRDSTELADGVVGAAGGENVPAIAAWNVGSGAVISAAFTPPSSLAEALVDRVATPPRDPRFRVTYQAARELRVTVDAIDHRPPPRDRNVSGSGGGGGGYLNGLAPRLEISLDAAQSTDSVVMPQIAPGKYEIAVPAPSRPSFAAVRINGRVIDRFAVAGRYTPEFEAIGNDRSAMYALASATGGAVIEPSQTAPIDFRWPTRAVPLTGFLAAGGAALLAAGLVRWRMS